MEKPISDASFKLWQGFCTMIVSAYFDRRMVSLMSDYNEAAAKACAVLVFCVGISGAWKCMR